MPDLEPNGLWEKRPARGILDRGLDWGRSPGLRYRFDAVRNRRYRFRVVTGGSLHKARRSPLRRSGRHVSDDRVQQRRSHCGHADAPALVALEKAILDQAPNAAGIDEAAPHFSETPGVAPLLGPH